MSILAGKRLYVDTIPFIYLGERHPQFGPPARALFQAAHAGEFMLVTSELTLAEVLVLPFRLGQEDLQSQYIEALMLRPYLEVVAATREIMISSAKIGASVGIKLPDSIHVATALAANCALFVSEDKGIRAP